LGLRAFHALTLARVSLNSRPVRRRKLQNRVAICLVAASLLSLPGCDRTPRFVYVLQAPQSVELSASASASTVTAGTPFVLHGSRTSHGVWKRIESKDLLPDQCWIAEIPPENEPEVADNLLWRVKPADGVKFNTDFRTNRTREVTVSNPGTYTFVSSSGPWCERGRTITAAPFTVNAFKPQ